MKVLICVLGLLATVAWTQEWDLSTLRSIQEHPAHGFGGFYFGASKEFVRSERQQEGRTFSHETPGWLWYEGEIDGCQLDIGFEFTSDKLNSGLWQITNNEVCFHAIQNRLIDVYGRDLTMEIRGSTIKAEMEVRYTRIVHEKNDRWHGVSFYDTTPGGG